MKTAAILFSMALSMSAGLAIAQDAMKTDAMKDGAMSKDMTMAQCKDHMRCRRRR